MSRVSLSRSALASKIAGDKRVTWNFALRWRARFFSFSIFTLLSKHDGLHVIVRVLSVVVFLSRVHRSVTSTKYQRADGCETIIYIIFILDRQGMASLREIIANDLFASIPEGGGKFLSSWNDWFIIACDHLDPRVKDWPLMQSVLPTVFIVIAYLAFLVFGRQWMKNRKPFELREFMFVYNFFQVVFCAYVTYEVSAQTM